MPELPEVETIRLQLLSKLRGRMIKKVEIKFAGLLKAPAKKFIPPPSRIPHGSAMGMKGGFKSFRRGTMPRGKVGGFIEIVTGAKVTEIKRRAKVLMIVLSNGWTILIHLKMTGQLIYDGKVGIGKPHIIYTFNNGIQLKHYDFRKFGYVKLAKTKDVEKILAKENFGPEPLEKAFTLKQFKELLARRARSPIKPLLMDQTFVAGVGNIYAQEACFYARVLPTRKAGSLSDKETKNMHTGLLKILRTAIKAKGSSVDSYVDALGAEGNYVSRLKVYSRGGQKCLRCGAVLKEGKLAGRGTVWCAKCQR